MEPTTQIHQGDCRDILKTLPDNSIDSVVTDPPYELGFMGKKWDNTGIAYDTSMWAEVLRVLKPGGHLLAFGGTRTYHRMVVAIEDAGFEIRDSIHWIYGSGFPKSLDVSKAIDKAAGAEREVIGTWKPTGTARPSKNGSHNAAKTTADGGYEPDTEAQVSITAPATAAAKQWEGWGTALKPAHEPIVVARKPVIGTVAANVLQHGTGALNIDGCRVPTDGARPLVTSNRRLEHNTYGPGLGGSKNEGTTDSGRWPANVIHDGSDEVVRLFPETAANKANTQSDNRSVSFYQAGDSKSGGVSGRRDPANTHNDNGGSAARFFYAAKASRAERNAGLEALPADKPVFGDDGGTYQGLSNSKRPQSNFHPTVKPLALMRYLLKLVTPPGGTTLDPFAGSGTTLAAAIHENLNAIGIELTPEYHPIIQARIKHAQATRKPIQ
jgi:DNA modification methylase